MNKTGRKPILCIDFDGVLHYYRNGWEGPLEINDLPVPGSLDFINNAMDYFEIIVLTSRACDNESIEAIKQWLEKHNFPKLEVTNKKPPAFLSIDDRALRFDGIFLNPKELIKFKPWNRE